VLEKELKAVQQMVKEEMENMVELSIPLEVEIHWGKNWNEAHRKKYNLYYPGFNLTELFDYREYLYRNLIRKRSTLLKYPQLRRLFLHFP
jgi:hypothetical protein